MKAGVKVPVSYAYICDAKEPRSGITYAYVGEQKRDVTPERDCTRIELYQIVCSEMGKLIESEAKLRYPDYEISNTVIIPE